MKLLPLSCLHTCDVVMKSIVSNDKIALYLTYYFLPYLRTTKIGSKPFGLTTSTSPERGLHYYPPQVITVPLIITRTRTAFTVWKTTK